MLRGDLLDALSRSLGVEIARLERWRARALEAIEAGLRERGSDPVEHELALAKVRIGDLSMENELLRAMVGKSGPFVTIEIATMGAAVSPASTLKEQAMLGREFESVDEVRGAVGDFVARYNTKWCAKKIGFFTPREARSGFGVRQTASYNLVSRQFGSSGLCGRHRVRQTASYNLVSRELGAVHQFARTGRALSF
jgi:hypothetical protein